MLHLRRRELGRPHPDGRVGGACNDAAPVRRDRYAPDGAGVAIGSEQFGSGVGVPHPRGFVVRTGDDTSSRPALPPRPDGASMALELEQLGSVLASHTRAVLSFERVTMRPPVRRYRHAKDTTGRDP